MSPAATRDTRYVYGAMCTWNGPVQEARPTSGGLPGCPYCGGLLLELSDEQQWTGGAAVYETQGHPGYVEFLRWLKGRCFRGRGIDGLKRAAETYTVKTGKAVQLG